MASLEKIKMIIDTDPGLDDAQAIMMATSSSNVEVLAITCIAGNNSLEQVTLNALRVLKACGRLDIPVYRGSGRTILGKQPRPEDYHGKDGFGDSPDPEQPDLTIVKDEHAVLAMTRIVRENPKNITIVTLGPLTNLALAIRLFPDFGNLIKELYIMGGNTEGLGNVSVSAEFNFRTDPEAAYIVLHEVKCPITMTSWELSVRHSFSWEWHSSLMNIHNAKAKLLQDTEGKMVPLWKTRFPRYITCDQIAMAVAVNKRVIKETLKYYTTVELQGNHTRGQMILDRIGMLNKVPNARHVLVLDMPEYKDLLMQALGHKQ